VARPLAVATEVGVGLPIYRLRSQMPFGIWHPTLPFHASDPLGQADSNGSGLGNRNRIQTDRGRHRAISKTQVHSRLGDQDPGRTNRCPFRPILLCHQTIDGWRDLWKKEIMDSLWARQ